MAAASANVGAKSLATVLQIQTQDNYLASNGRSSSASGASSARLDVALVNMTSSSNVYAYITGLSINDDNAVWLLQADGASDYLPESPVDVGTALGVPCAIPLGSPGSTTTVSIPQIAGGRIWFSVNSELTFLLNPGPGLVEPSVTNPSDPNINNFWDFCEFTWNSTQLFANISYVDFVSLPIALDTLSTTGAIQHVSGMSTAGLDGVCADLIQQSEVDGSDWKSLIVTAPDGSNLRAISPNNGIITKSALFANYYDSYVNQVWEMYTTTGLNIDTQASYGIVTGEVTSDLLTFPGGITFAKPMTGDVFSCSTGPFATGSNDEVNALIPRLAAAFNRSTLLIDSTQPDDEVVADYYKNPITNHFSRICHENNLDKLGYGFPYDDVAATIAGNQSGAVADGSPQLFTVTVGGSNAHTKIRTRRGLPTIATITHQVASTRTGEKSEFITTGSIDVERGKKLSERIEKGRLSSLRNALPPIVRYGRMVPQLQPLLDNAGVRQVFEVGNSVLTSILSASARALISRILLVVLILLFYMTIELLDKSS